MNKLSVFKIPLYPPFTKGEERLSNSSSKGSAAVEFALILPVLVVLLFGIIEFGLIFYNKAVITNASREGARYGIVFRVPETEITCDEITGVIQNYVAGKLVTFGDTTDVDTDYDPADCDPDSGSNLTVTVTYLYDYLLLPNLVATLTGPITLSGETVMVKE